jgi:alpha-L-rhamnosidase
MYGGEDYDARLEQKGWNTWSFDDSEWRAVVIQEPPKGKLTPQTAPPVKIMETYPIKEIKKGDNFYTLDMGQNLSGFPLIRVSGKKGDKIRLWESR